MEIAGGWEWEEEIYDFVKKYLQVFFNEHKFQFLKKYVAGGTMGAVIVFSDSNILIEIINDRNSILLNIGQIDERLFWNINLIRSYFRINDETVNETDIENRKRILFDVFYWDNYSEISNYLIVNFSRIKDAFSSMNYCDMKSKLVKLNEERSQYVRQTYYPNL